MNVSRNTFSREEKLKSKKSIEQLFKKGRVISALPLKAFYVATNKESELKVAVSVPKKHIKLAVDRNLIKRRVREAYRLNNSALKLKVKEKKSLDVMFIYHSSQILSYQEIEEKIKVILNRLIEQG